MAGDEAYKEEPTTPLTPTSSADDREASPPREWSSADVLERKAWIGEYAVALNEGVMC